MLGLPRIKVSLLNRLFEKNEPEKPDVFTQLLGEFQAGAKTEKDRQHFHGDVNVAVVAGRSVT
jgi:cytochrome P450 family 628